MEAYELCVKGRGHWNQRGPGLMKGLHYFELALLEDPGYALAWSGLADAYSLLGIYDFLPFREAAAKAKTAAEKAVALDDNSAEAHCSLGVVLSYGDWDWYGSERHLLKALELDSNYTPARYWYAWLLIHTGRDQEAIAQNRRAVEGDPFSKAAHSYLGWSFNSLKCFAEALAPLRRSLELDPNFAVSHNQLGRAYWFLGDCQAALVELHRAVELSGRLPAFLSTLGQALALSGQEVQARQIQRELAERTVPAPTRSYFLYNLHTALGENDLAFAALEQALVEREFFLAWFPLRRSAIELMSLEADPRWPAFIEKVKAAVRAGGSATI
jgi:tetratricopeptide (TPR) repeat protein